MSRCTSPLDQQHADLDSGRRLLDEQPALFTGYDYELKKRDQRWTWGKSLSITLRCWTMLSTTLCLILLAKVVSLDRHNEFVANWRCNDPLKETHFYRDTRMMTLDHENDYLWKEMMSPAYGVIKSPAFPGDNQTVAAISMFHQLHCVAAVRAALQQAYEGKDIGFSWKDGGHWPHCLDYFVSIITCYADDTIERPIIESGTGRLAIDGAMDVRYCRDTRKLHDLWREKGAFGQFSHDD